MQEKGVAGEPDILEEAKVGKQAQASLQAGAPFANKAADDAEKGVVVDVCFTASVVGIV